MKTLNSITKRLDSLEKSKNNDRTLIFVEFEGLSAEESTRHVYNLCEKCCDPDILESALGEAIKRDPGKNDHKDIVVITKEVILDVVQRLRKQDVNVRL